ncbi:hypothetical protein IMZ31_22340 (plasmid) [Pontibacillus sp. ALD_SL1]|uniref:hypothetical protein n=1 Tax=Pontibacillus sp. ALD_SL1 TaxID=2777185 RepID=UPI001A975F18|nr:hypothetical protein [Pontibacillus sp. ALD_SL1]QST02195.1 hypothetical protein IMZ31_22340 [Pontibacillus sp. ALD_SL1]
MKNKEAITKALMEFMGITDLKILRKEIRLLENNGEEIVLNVADQYGFDEEEIEDVIRHDLP